MAVRHGKPGEVIMSRTRNYVPDDTKLHKVKNLKNNRTKYKHIIYNEINVDPDLEDEIEGYTLIEDDKSVYKSD